MLHEIIKGIKSEKKMSLKHWRYRVMHWTFGVKVDEHFDWERSPLPRFLYTHYCPLFHLTNMIAIFSPLIFLVKLVIATVMVAGWIGLRILQAVDLGARVTHKVYKSWNNARQARIVARRPPAPPKPEPIISAEELEAQRQAERERERQTRIAKDRAKVPKFVLDLARRALEDGRYETYLKEFDDFLSYHRSDFYCIDQDAIRQIWEKHAGAAITSLAKRKARQERMRDFVVFWVNFSRMFIKGTLNLFYFALFLGVMWLTYQFGWPTLKAVGSAIAWVFSMTFAFDWLSFFSAVATWTLRVGVGIGVVGSLVYLAAKFIPFRRIGGTVAIPFVAIGDLFHGLGKYIEGCVIACVEFVSIFYEENCPTERFPYERQVRIRTGSQGHRR